MAPRRRVSGMDAWLQLESEARQHYKLDSAGAVDELKRVWTGFSAETQKAIGDGVAEYNKHKQAFAGVRQGVRKLKDPKPEDEAAPEIFKITKESHDTLFAYGTTYLNVIHALLDDLNAAGIDSDEENGRQYLDDLFREAQQVVQDATTKSDELQATIAKHKAEWTGLRPSWLGDWFLGAGSNGSASRWVKRDKDGRIADRLVVKDGKLASSKLPWYWAQDPRNPDLQVSTEALAMFNLRGREGSHTIVSIRNWTRPRQNWERFYLEYCPYGDLFTVSTLSGWQPPEPFLWHAFECLAISGLLQEYGELVPNPFSQWQSIIHRDYKVSNVFLGTPGEKYAGWPTPKLGDFGLCLVIPKGEERTAHKRPKGPDSVDISGSQFNRAPEQAARPSAPDSTNEDAETLPMTAKTNVWGIGTVIWSLMECHEGDARLKWDLWWDEDRTNSGDKKFGLRENAVLDEPDFTDKATSKYSEEFLRLVSECLRYERDARPSFAQLLKRIRNYREEGLHDRLQHAAANDKGFEEVMKVVKEDWWAIDKMVPSDAPLPEGLKELPDPPDDDSSDNDDQLPGGPTASGKEIKGLQRAAPKAPKPLSGTPVEIVDADPTVQDDAQPDQPEVPECSCGQDCAKDPNCRHRCCRLAHRGYNAAAQHRAPAQPKRKLRGKGTKGAAGGAQATKPKLTLKNTKARPPSRQAMAGAEAPARRPRKRAAEDDEGGIGGRVAKRARGGK